MPTTTVDTGSMNAKASPGWLVGERVSLRLLTPNDCSDVYVRWLADPEVNQYLETRWTEQTIADLRSFVKAAAADANTYLFGIFGNDEHRHVGNIKVGPVNRNHLYASVGYFIGDRTVWGKGFARDAVRQAVSFAFTDLGLERVHAGAYAANKGSIKVLMACGFQQEGVRRQMVKVSGGRDDVIEFGLLRSEWCGSPEGQR